MLTEQTAINYSLYCKAYANTRVLTFHSKQIHDDLEKEPEYSGSGFGPDDEDSNTNQHKKPTPHQKTSKDKVHESHATNVKNTQKPQEKHIDVDGDDEDSLGGSGDKSDEDNDGDDVSEPTFGKGPIFDGKGEEDDRSEHAGGTNFNKPKNYDSNEDEDDLTTVIEEKTEDVISSKIKHFNFFSVLFIFFSVVVFPYFVSSSTTNKSTPQKKEDILRCAIRVFIIISIY